MEFGKEFGSPKALVKVAREGPLFVLTMHEVENRFTGPFMKSLVAALNAIKDVHEKEGNPPAAVVSVTADDKIWSNGLDLAEAGRRGTDYIKEFMGVLEKFLTFPMPTVAAINGHAFAGGFLLSLCHDYRTFQSNRGFLCMNEIDMPAAMNPGLLSVLEAKLPTARDYRDVMLYGTRFPAGEAFKRGFIDAAGKDGAETIKLAKELGLKFASKARAGMIMGLLKDEVYAKAKKELREARLTARPTPEQQKRLTENVQKGMLEDAKKAKAKM